MKDILEAIQFCFACLIPISLFGMAAWLIYKNKDGWGWFLFAVVMIVGQLHIKVGS